MPVFLITIHAYRSWNADHPRGYVRHGKGILPPNAEQAKAYDKRAADLPALFGDADQAAIASIAADACIRRDWRLHAIALEPSHVHILMSWKDDTRSDSVCGKLKNLISRELNLGLATKRKWLSRGASRKRVNDRGHFDHLVLNYLPKHGGLFWKEGMPPLPPPASARG
jgi:REP element-mobilizing transposase RayT